MAKPIKIEILGDSSSFEKAAGKVEKTTGSMAGSIVKLGGLLAGAFAGVQLAGVIKDSIGAASDLEEVASKTGVVFEGMTDQIMASANKAAVTLGLSKTDYMDYTSSIAAALKAGGMGIEETTALSERAVKNFADIASFHNSTAEDVSMSWQSAMRGSYEPIQKYMPFINDAFLKTYGTTKGLIDENTKSLDANQRAIILDAIALDEELNPAIDDFSETSDGFANSQRIMGAQWEDLKAKMGNVFLPVAKTVMGFVANTLLPGFEKVISIGEQVYNIFAKRDFVSGFLNEDDSIVGKLFNIRDALASVWNAVSDVVDAFKSDGLGGAMKQAGESFGALWESAKPHLSAFGVSLIEWVQDQLPPLLEKLEEWARAFVDWVGPKIPPLLRELGELLRKLGEWLWKVGLPIVVEHLAKWAAAFIEWVGPQIPPLLRELGSLLESLVDWIWNVGLPELLLKLDEWGQALVDWVQPRIAPLLEELGLLLIDIVDWIVTDAVPTVVTELGKLGLKAGEELVDKIGEEILKLPGRMEGWFKSMKGPSLWDLMFGDGEGITGGGGGGSNWPGGGGSNWPGGGGSNWGRGGVSVTGRTAPGGTWKKLIDMASATGVPGVRATSVFRPGAITRSGNPSYHGMNRAVDFAAPDLRRLHMSMQRFGPMLKELIGPIPSMNWRNGRPHRYNAAVQGDHYDHVHAAYDRGGFLPPGVHTIGNFTKKPEPILTHEQWQIMRRAAGLEGGGTRNAITVNVQSNANPHDIAREIDWQLKTAGR